MKKEEFVYIGRRLYEEGLVDSHGGGMSVREGDSIYITKRDVKLSELEDGDIIKVPLAGPSGKDEEASRELPTHRYIYANSSAKVVVHAFPPHAVGLSITENKIVPQDAHAQNVIKGAPIIRVRNAVGSEEAGKYLVNNAYSNGYTVAMVKGFASFAIGETLEEAYRYTSCLENSCKTLFVVKTIEGVGSGAASRDRGGRSQGGGRDRGIRDRGRERSGRGHSSQGRGRGMQGRDSHSAIPPGIGVMDRSRRGRR